MNSSRLVLAVIIGATIQLAAQPRDTVKSPKASTVAYGGRFASTADSVRLYGLRRWAMRLRRDGQVDSAVVVGELALAFARKCIVGGDHPDLARSINDAGVFHAERGGFPRSELLFGEALAMARRVYRADHLDLANTINNVALFLNGRGRREEAEALFGESLGMQRRLYPAGSLSLATAINNVAQFYGDWGRYEDAEPLFREAVAMFRTFSRSDDDALAVVIGNLGVFLVVRGRLDDAEPLLVESLAIQRRLHMGDHPNLANSISNMAGILRKLGRYAEAEPLCVEAVTMRRRLYASPHPKLIESIGELAALRTDQGRFIEAEPLHSEAVMLCRELYHGDHPDLAVNINNRALFYFKCGRYEEAEPAFIESLAMTRRLYSTDHADLATNINNLALFYNEIGRYSEAETLYLEALAMNRRIYSGDAPLLATSLTNMAEFYQERGRVRQSVELYTEALRMNMRLYSGDYAATAGSISNLASVYAEAGLHELAEPFFREALSILRRLYVNDHPDLATLLNNAAMSSYSAGHYTEADSLCREALSMRRRLFRGDQRSLAVSLTNLAVIEHACGNHVVSESLLVEALAMFRRLFSTDHPELAGGLNNLAAFYLNQGRYAEAEPLYLELIEAASRQRLSAARFGSEPDQLQFAATASWRYDAIASFVIYRLPERPALAGSLTQLAMESKSSILDLVAKQRRELANLRQHDTAAARIWDRYVESARRVQRHLREIPNDTAQYRIWQEERTRLESDRNAAEQQLARIASPLLADDSTNWRDVQRALKPDEAAVEFLDFRYHDGKDWTDSTFYYGIVMRPGMEQPAVIKLCEARELETLLRPAPGQANSYLRNAETNAALYRAAFAPLEPVLAGAGTVYLSPSGLLSRVSFAALGDSAGRRLADRFDLRYMSNTKALRGRGFIAEDADSAEEKSRTAVVFGGAIYDLDSAGMVAAAADARRGGTGNVLRGGDIPDDSARREGLRYLPGSRREADSVNRLFAGHGWSIECDTALRATEERFKGLASPRVLHIATHGFFFAEPVRDTGRREMLMQGATVLKAAENPMLRSGLLLSGAARAWAGKAPPAGAEDGIVTAYEIASMDLSKTELVTLSACETGLGDINGSEGVFGLQRAFRIAGARSVLITLWNVDDRATEQFMREFYTRRLGGKTQHEAFAEAQAALRATTDNPMLWAPFVLVER